MANKYSVEIEVKMDTSGVTRSGGQLPSQVERIAQRTATAFEKNFAGLPKHAQRAFASVAKESEISARASAKAMEQAARASENAKKREFQTFERIERQKAQVAQREARAIEKASQSAARNSSTSFTDFLGASFFANLGARAVSSFMSYMQRLPGEAAKLAAEAQNALKGLESVSVFKGIDKDTAKDAVQNLRFVRGGIISIAEASTALKNLLSTGFSLPEAITLMERFSDASAFGKQAALGYGEAIRGASEGIKNQNSLLVDNVGITKNLSVIMKERGFEIQDLADKTKGAAARQALYNGLLVESQAQVGDADKVMQGYTGTIAAQDLAYQNLQRALGNLIITNPAIIESAKIVTEQFREQTAEINNSDSAVNDFAEGTISAWGKIKANAIPAVATIANLVKAVASSLGVIVTAAVGAILRLLEEVANAFLGVGNTIVNGVKIVINGVVSAIQAAGVDKLLNLSLGKLEIGAPPKANFGSEFMFGKAKEALDDVVKSIQKVAAIDEQRAVNALRIDIALQTRQQEQAAQRRADKMSGVDRRAEAEARLQRSQALSDSVLSTSAGRVVDTSGTTEKAKKVKKAKEVIDEVDKFTLEDLRDLQEFFQRATGRALPFKYGQSGYHNKLGLDHRFAADIQVNPNTPDGKLVISYLEARGTPYRAFSGPYRNADGVLTSTGAHIHAGEASRRFGAKVRRRDVSRRDDLLTVPLPDGQLVQVGQYQIDAALQGLLTRQFDKAGRAAGFKYSGAVRPTEGGLGAFGGEDRLRRQLTGAELSRRGKDEEYLGRYEETSKGVYERVGGAYQALIDRQINLQGELGDVWRDSLLERKNQELELIVNLERAEARLAELRMDATDDQLTEQRRLLMVRREEITLTERLQQLQDEDATDGANAALRQQIALMEELNALKRADIDAVESQIRSQVRLSDATIYHAEQSNAKVLEFLASQRTVTDVIADAKISVIESTYDLIDRGLDSMTKKLGVIGSILKDVISGFIRLALNRAFQTMLGGGGGGGGGVLTGGFSGGQGGGGFLGNAGGGIAGIIRGIFGGGASVSGTALSSSGTAAGNSAGSALARMLSGGSSVATPVSASGAAVQQAGLGNFLSSIFGGGGGAAGAASIGSMLATAGPAAAVAIALQTYQAALGGNIGPGKALLGGGLLGLGLSYIGRSRLRRREETARNQLGTDARAEVYALIASVRSNPQNATGAMDAYNGIKQEYLAEARKLTDRRTRENAIKWWDDMDRDVLPLLQREISKAQGYLATAPLLHSTYDVSRYSLGLSNNSIASAAGGGMSPASAASLSSITSIPRPNFPSIGGGSTNVGASTGVGQIAPPQMNVSVSIDRNGIAQVTVASPLFKEAAVAAVRMSISDNPAGIPLAIKAANEKFLGA